EAQNTQILDLSQIADVFSAKLRRDFSKRPAGNGGNYLIEGKAALGGSDRDSMPIVRGDAPHRRRDDNLATHFLDLFDQLVEHGAVTAAYVSQTLFLAGVFFARRVVT